MKGLLDRRLGRIHVWLDEGTLRKALVVNRLRFEVSRSQYSRRYHVGVEW